MTPPIDNITAEGQLQDQRYVDMAYDNVAPHHPPQPGVSSIVSRFLIINDTAQPLVVRYEYDHARGMNGYVRAPQNVAAQPQAISPPGPVCANTPVPHTL